MLDAIQIAVERVDADHLGDLVDTRAQLLAAIAQAHSPMTDNVNGDSIARAAMEEERSGMLRFIATLREDEITQVEPLPYRHVLEDATGQQQWQHLAHIWGIDSRSPYWYPLSASSRADVIAFDVGYFARDVRLEQLHATLSRMGDTRVWEFREFGMTARLDLSLFEPGYTGEEGYWSNSGGEWIVYASHESSLTVGGSLLPEIQRIWPVWSQHLWTGAY